MPTFKMLPRFVFLRKTLLVSMLGGLIVYCQRDNFLNLSSVRQIDENVFLETK